jgi:signal transduction histidine kinase
MNTDKYQQKDVNFVLDRLNDIASMVMYAAEAGSLERVLERIAEVSRELIQTKYAALGVPDVDGTMKVFKVVGLSPEEVSRIPHPPRGLGLLGAIIHERQTIRLERMADDPRSSGFPANHPPMTSLLGVPIQIGKQLFGMLYLTDRVDGQPFTEQDEILLETLAGYAALAIAGSELRERENRVSLLEERERISMELHDGVIQSLYAVGMHLDLMRVTGDLTTKNVSAAIDNLNQVIEDIRAYIHDLKYSSYDQKTLDEYLREMFNRLHVPKSLKIEIDAPDYHLPMMPAVFEAVCQIANEAVSNAVRHAKASQIKVSGAVIDHHLLQITVEDNGRGFDMKQIDNGAGLGLRNMRQRVRLHNGQLKISSAPDKGTKLVITVPMRRT